MSFKSIQVGPWLLAVDLPATRQAYAQLHEEGVPEALCTCSYCRNFALAQPALFPPEVRALFEQLGIDARYPSEVIIYNRTRPGEYVYGGWYHVIGQIIEDDAGTSHPTDHQQNPNDMIVFAENFRLRLTTEYLPRPNVFDRSNLVALDFDCNVPWLLDEPQPD